MTVWFIDGSKIDYSINAKMSVSKKENKIYIEDKGEAYEHSLDIVKEVEFWV